MIDEIIENGFGLLAYANSSIVQKREKLENVVDSLIASANCLSVLMNNSQHYAIDWFVCKTDLYLDLKDFSVFWRFTACCE